MYFQSPLHVHLDSPKPLCRLLKTAPRFSSPSRAGRAATWRAPGVMAAALCFHQQGVSHRPPQSLSWANTRADAAANLTAGATTEAAAALFSLSSFSSAATAAARPTPPPPASAQSPPSPPRELSQRFAPPRPDWPAEHAASQWSRLEAVSLAALGLPAEPAAAGSKEVRAQGRRRRARSGAGRTPRGAPDPGAGGTQVGRGETPLLTEEEPSRPSWWGRRTG